MTRRLKEVEDDLPPLGEVLDFMRILWEVDHSLQRLSTRMELALGVTGRQRLLIRIVGRFPGITPRQLAELLRVSPSTLTGILKRLGRQGLVQMRTDARDRRRALVGLTSKGRRLNRALPGTVEAVIQQVISRAPPRAMRSTRSLLLSVAVALEDAATAASSKSRKRD